MTDTVFQNGVGRALRRFLGVPLRPQTYRNLAYLALAFPLGLAYFVGVVTGLSLGTGLLVTLVGVPLLFGTVAAATVAAGFEAVLARRLVGVDATPPAALRALGDGVPDGGVLDAAKRFLAAPTTWASLCLVVAKFAFGVAAFVALVTAGTVSGALLGAPLLYDVAPYRVGPYPVDTLPEAAVVAVLGAVLALVSLHALNALARLHAGVTAALLGDLPRSLRGEGGEEVV